MKRTTLVILILILAIAISVTACRKPVEEKKGLLLEYKVDGILYQSVEYDGELVLPETPQKEGYTFEGWFMEESCITPLNTTILDTKKNGSTLSVYACFKPIPNVGITINFMVDGTFYRSQLYKGIYKLPEEPIKKGFDFEGWYLDKTFDTPLSKIKLDETADGTTLIVYAKFVEGEKQGITINYILEGALYQSIVYKGELVLPEEPKKDGFIFHAWILSSEEVLSKDYLDTLEDGTTISVIASFTEIKKKDVTLVFIVEGREYARFLCDYSIMLPADPIVEYMEFKGWYLDSNCTLPLTEKSFYDFSDKSEVKVFASFVEEELINITINFVDDVLEYPSITYSGILYGVPTAWKQGFQFKGWYLDKDHTIELSEEVLNTLDNNASINVYSYFVKNAGTTIIFMVDDAVYHTMVYDGFVYLLPDAPRKEGLSFEDWYIDQAFDERYTFDYMNEQEDGSTIIVYAKFSDKVGQRLTFYVFGEEVYSYLYFDDLILPTSPYKFGYRFEGWFFKYTTIGYIVNEENLYTVPDGAEINIYAEMVKTDRTFSEEELSLTLRLDSTFVLRYECKAGYGTYEGVYTEDEENVLLTFDDKTVEKLVIDETEETVAYEQSLIDYCLDHLTVAAPSDPDAYIGSYKQYRTDDNYLGFLDVYLNGYGFAEVSVSIYGSWVNLNAQYIVNEENGVKNVSLTLQNDDEKMLYSIIEGDEIIFTDEIFYYFCEAYNITKPIVEPEPPKEPRKELDFVLPTSPFTYTTTMSDGEFHAELKVQFDGKITKATLTADFEVDGIPLITYMDSEKFYCFDDGEWNVKELGDRDFLDVISDLYIITIYYDVFSYKEQAAVEKDDTSMRFLYSDDEVSADVTVDTATHAVLSAIVTVVGEGTLTIQGSIVYSADNITLPAFE